MIVRWATFIAILGCVQPAGCGVSPLLSLLKKLVVSCSQSENDLIVTLS